MSHRWLSRTILLFAVCLSGQAAGGEEAPETVEYGKGFYGPEQGKEQGKTWRWMSGEGVVRVPSSDRARKLTIVGNVIEGSFTRRPTVTIKFNGTTLEKFSAPKGMLRKEYTLTPAQQGANGWSELLIHTDLTVVPKDFIKGSNDTRELGFKLHDLRWENEAVGLPPDPDAQPSPQAKAEIPTTGPSPPPPDLDAQPSSHARPIYRVAAVFLFLLLASGALLTWLYGRRRRVGEGTPPPPAGPAAPLRVRCAGCGQALTARATLAGKKVKCPHCGQPVRLPEDGPGIPPPAPDNEQAGTAAAGRLAGRLAGLAVLALLLGVGGLFFALSPPRRPALLNTLLGCEPVAGVAESGFYDPEVDPLGKPFRWTDGKARLVIPLDRAKPPRALWIQFHTLRSPGVPPVTVRVVVNGRDLFNGEPTDDRWEKTVDLSQGGLGDELTLDILSNTFLPQDVPGSTSSDARPLGVRVTGVRLLGPSE